MSNNDYKNNPQLLEHKTIKIGNLYFFNNFVITEFHEGVHIDFDAFEETRDAIQNFFEEKSFGFIGNRKNTYSLDLNDAKRFNSLFPNLKAYAVVCNSLIGAGVFEVENHFFSYNRKKFSDLNEAIDWVKDILKTK